MRRMAIMKRACSWVIGLLLGGAALHGGPLVAAGIPQQQPLFYSGVLENAGGLVEGDHPIGLLLWDAATGGNQLCTTAGRAKIAAVPYAVEAGRASEAAGALSTTITGLDTRLAAVEARPGGAT